MTCLRPSPKAMAAGDRQASLRPLLPISMIMQQRLSKTIDD